MPENPRRVDEPHLEIDSIDDEISSWTGVPIDGLVRLIERREGSEFKHILPFRTNEYANTPKEDPPPYVWLWENPNEPLSQITLHPSFQTSTVHVQIRDGVIVEM